MCPAHWLGTGVFPGRAGGRELPLRERAQTGRGSPSAVSWARRAVPVFLSPCAEDRLGCRSLTQHSAQGQLWCHTHPRPPSCRGGQRLSRTDPGVRERAEPDPKPHVPTVRGCSLSCPPGPQPCSPRGRPSAGGRGLASCSSFWPGSHPWLAGRASAAQRPRFLQPRSCKVAPPARHTGNEGCFEASDAPGAAGWVAPPSLRLSPGQLRGGACPLGLGPPCSGPPDARLGDKGLHGNPTCLADVAPRNDGRAR